MENTTKKKTASISLDTIKNEGWNDVAFNLGLSEEEIKAHFKYGEFASITIEIDEDLKIVGGYVHKL